MRKNGLHDVIINRPIVYLPWKQQLVWLKNAYDKNIRNFIFVGGESSAISYPGTSVIEAATLVTTTKKNEFSDLILGGILIPGRKYEAEKLIKKSQAGIEFFTTQIVYETDDIKKVLKDYWKLCVKKKLQPKMIFISFAPVATKKDIDLLVWLGVKISDNTIEYLKTGWLGMAERSIRLCLQGLEDIFDFVETNNIDVPIGINVEHINQHNFELSFLLLERIKKVYL